ncbi:MAG: glutaminyl-peptide cyclotransferase [Bacteroidetes bacterium]|nr:glutaminyl-peptide cyclotransferase [Bacteroidota bacterium]
MKKIILFLAFSFMLSACGGQNVNKKSNIDKVVNYDDSQSLSISFMPIEKKVFSQGEILNVGYKLDKKVDSVILEVVGKDAVIKELESDSLKGNWSIKTSEKTKVGRVIYKFTFFKDKKRHSKQSSFKLLPSNKIRYSRVDVKKTIPMPKYFLQGLEIVGDTLYISSGGFGNSYIETVTLSNLKRLNLGQVKGDYFAEGLTVLGDKLFVLTWQNKKILTYDRKTLKLISEKDYIYDGWGLTNDGKYLYASDGTNVIHVLNPKTLEVVDNIEVLTSNGAVNYINELEWINGKIWANVFTNNFIVIINPMNGSVEEVMSCDELENSVKVYTPDDVLNGIAYDKKTNDLYLSGKNWCKMFIVKKLTVEK